VGISTGTAVTDGDGGTIAGAIVEVATAIAKRVDVGVACVCIIICGEHADNPTTINAIIALTTLGNRFISSTFRK
jgi:hypothetical protein